MNPIPSNSYKPIRRVLLSLYFLLTLSPGEFGHICDFTAYPTRLYFSPRISKIGAEISQPTGSGEQAESAGKSEQAESVLASVSSKYCDESTEFLLEHLFKREVGLHGRIAYVAKVTWDNQSAVLKLAWSATDRIPENAIYDILLKSEVQGIPQLFSRGLLIEGFRGYRLEYIVMEDCGVPLLEALKTLRPRGEEKFVSYLKQIIEEVTACLVDASVAGVLHRDISDSNIAVQIDQGRVSARIIDWGYAKDTNWKSDASGDIGDKWHYSSEYVGQNEDAHDPFTGTPRFMSISTLTGIKYRNVATDIESFFYVVLNALCDIYPTKTKKTPVGFGSQQD
ncbi:hypothetical protein LPJ56_006878, partial [Coemansia sp. RSA 2599]